MFNMSMDDFGVVSNEINEKSLLENRNNKFKYLDAKPSSIFGMILKDKSKALEDMDFLDSLSFREDEQHNKDDDDDDNNCSFCCSTKYHKINSYVYLVSAKTDSSNSISEIESTNN